MAKECCLPVRTAALLVTETHHGRMVFGAAPEFRDDVPGKQRGSHNPGPPCSVCVVPIDPSRMVCRGHREKKRLAYRSAVINAMVSICVSGQVSVSARPKWSRYRVG
uniref:Uncharacterized protein n=1 Tax=Anopheles culicifacies TaxID=139723 RepID=A0A182MEN0_9DIPT